MITCKVIRKYIQPLPLQDAIMRTDSLADTVCFEIPNYQDSVDFSTGQWQWFVYYKTSIDPPNVVPVTVNVSEDKKLITVRWVISHYITKRSGDLDIQLRAKLDTSEGLVKWNSSVCTVNIGHSLDPDSCDTDENILEWYLDRMEQLAQSGIADIQAERDRAMAAEAELDKKIESEIERSTNEDKNLNDKILSLNESFSGVNNKLDQEIERSVSEDLRLDQEIKAETERAEQKEAEISSALQDEVNRAESAESALQSNIDKETERAKQAELNLSIDIINETNRATEAENEIRQQIDNFNADINSKIDAETDRAMAREAELDSKIDSETSRAEQREAELDGRIDDTNTNIQAEANRAMVAEQEIRVNLAEETNRAEEAEQLLQSNLDAETSRAKEAESVLQSNIDAEQKRATEAETQLQNNIDTEKERAENAESQLQSNIDAEKKRAEDAEKVLQENIDAEETRAVGRENEIEDALEAEVLRATTAEKNLSDSLVQNKSELTSLIQAEETRATEAETQLQTNIDATNTALNEEVARATAREDELDTKIDETGASLTSNINILQQDLTEERQTRENETRTLTENLNTTNTNLSTLTNRVATEETTRETADTAMQGELDSIIVTRINNPTSTVSARYNVRVTKNGVQTVRGVNIDIPVTDAITSGEFNQETGNLVLYLANGDEIAVPIGDLVQYYDAGEGLAIQRVDETNNKFIIKLSSFGTQNILSTSNSDGGLSIDLSGYYTKAEANNLLSQKQGTLISDTSSTGKYYPPITVDDANIIHINTAILTDLGIAFEYSGDARAWVLNLSNTTINGQSLGSQASGEIVGKTIRLYESVDGTNPPITGNVLIAGNNGAYKDSGFTINKSVPADAKFTDTTYDPVSETVSEGLFTRTEQVKLEGIEEGAEVNVQSDWNAVDGDAFIKNKPGLASDTENGFMSSSDKTKLDTVEAGAQPNKNAFSSITVGTETLSAESTEDSYTLEGTGGTSVAVDTASKKITISSATSQQADWNQTDSSEASFIKNKPNLDALGYLPVAGGTMTGTINSRFVTPTANNTYDFGSDANRARNVYSATGYYLGVPADGKGIFYNAETGGFDFIC